MLAQELSKVRHSDATGLCAGRFVFRLKFFVISHLRTGPGDWNISCSMGGRFSPEPQPNPSIDPKMKLIRYSHPLRSVRDWDFLLGDPFRSFAPLFNRALQEARPSTGYGVAWYEDDTHYHAKVDLPGVKKEHLRLDAEDGLLRLTHEVNKEGEQEARSSKAELVLRCPDKVRLDGVEAKLADGILELSIPKLDVPKTFSVAIS